MTDLAALNAGYTRLKQGTLWHSTGRCKGFADANPGEAATLDQYVAAVVAGGTPPMPSLSTATGDGIARMVAAAIANGTTTTTSPPSATTTTTTTTPTVSGYRPFLATAAFNQPIPATAKIHADTAKLLSATSYWLTGGVTYSGIDLTPYKEWVGPRERVLYARGDYATVPKITVSVNFKDGTGYQCGAKTVTGVPMPNEWVTYFTNGPVSNDRILWWTDNKTGDAWESYELTPPGMASHGITCDSSKWNALRLDYWPGEEATGLGYGHGRGASASEIQMGACLLRPEDFADLSTGSVIPHALSLDWACGSTGSPYPSAVPPAGSGDGKFAAPGIPAGGRIQLDPLIDVESWPSVNAKTEPWRSALKKILRTLQVYGAIGKDTSGPGAGGLDCCHAGSVAPYVFPWQQAGYGWAYQNGIPYDLMGHFRVVDWNAWTGV